MAYPDNLQADLALALAQVGNTLVSAKVAEKAAIDAAAALERIQRAITARPGREPAQPPPAVSGTTPLAVRPKKAIELLGISRSTLWRLEKRGVLERTSSRTITMASIQRAAAARRHDH